MSVPNRVRRVDATQASHNALRCWRRDSVGLKSNAALGGPVSTYRGRSPVDDACSSEHTGQFTMLGRRRSSRSRSEASVDRQSESWSSWVIGRDDCDPEPRHKERDILRHLDFAALYRPSRSAVAQLEDEGCTQTVSRKPRAAKAIRPSIYVDR